MASTQSATQTPQSQKEPEQAEPAPSDASNDTSEATDAALEPSPSPLEEDSARAVKDTPELELIPSHDAEFVSEELPPDFWDSEPVQPAEDERIDSSLSVESFFDAAPSPAQSVNKTQTPASKPDSQADTAQAEAPQSETPRKAPPKTSKGEGRFGTPLFSELESLFPGRVVKVEEHPEEELDDTPSEDDMDDFQAA